MVVAVISLSPGIVRISCTTVIGYFLDDLLEPLDFRLKSTHRFNQRVNRDAGELLCYRRVLHSQAFYRALQATPLGIDPRTQQQSVF